MKNGTCANTEIRRNEAPVCYLKLPDGSIFLPIGPNLCFPRFIVNREEGLDHYRRWIKLLSENGANFFRLWLGHPFFDFEGERCGDFRVDKTETLRAVLDLALGAGMKVKLTLNHFRSIEPEPCAEIFPGAASFEKSKYHVAAGGVAESMTEYLGGEAGRQHFLSKVDFFAEHFGDHPALVAVELWNEMNAVGASNWKDWTVYMLPRIRARLPKLLCLQSLGSHCRLGDEEPYQWLAALPGVGCLQIHRYIDEMPGHFPCCSGPTDVMAASAIQYLRSMATGRPVILAESGAVDPGHRAPFDDYPKDVAGSILHDVLFAPFFAGSAGAGQCWHWDFYIDRNNLWHHFKPFAVMVEEIDPCYEEFVPHFSENSSFRVYELRGKSIRLFWLRDADYNWKNELRDGRSVPSQIGGQWVPSDYEGEGTWDLLDPWQSPYQWISVAADAEGVNLPRWKRSVILRQSKSSGGRAVDEASVVES